MVSFELAEELRKMFFSSCHERGKKKKFRAPMREKPLSTQRVTQREKRKATLKRESYDSSGLILQNKYLFRTKLADRGEEKQREKNFINNTLSVVKLEGRKLFSSTSCHNDRQIRFVLRFCCFSLIDST